MSIPNTRPLERPPIHPGEILRGDFLPDYGLTATALAKAVGGVSRQSMSEFLCERRAVSPAMALRLGKVFGMSAEFWLNLERNVDLWDVAHGLEEEPKLRRARGALGRLRRTREDPRTPSATHCR